MQEHFKEKGHMQRPRDKQQQWPIIAEVKGEHVRSNTTSGQTDGKSQNKGLDFKWMVSRPEVQFVTLVCSEPGTTYDLHSSKSLCSGKLSLAWVGMPSPLSLPVSLSLLPSV